MHKILLWLGYPTVKNFRRYLYSFWRNSRTWQTHRQTDGRTDTAWQHRPRLCIASRSKNVQRKSCEFRFIRGFYVSISIRNILKENLQPKLKVSIVWPKSTAVITGVIFTCPGRAGPVFITQNVAWMKTQFSACQITRSMYLSIFNSFRVIRCISQCISPKIAIFTKFLFPQETPLGQSC